MRLFNLMVEQFTLKCLKNCVLTNNAFRFHLGLTIDFRAFSSTINGNIILSLLLLAASFFNLDQSNGLVLPIANILLIEGELFHSIYWVYYIKRRFDCIVVCKILLLKGDSHSPDAGFA